MRTLALLDESREEYERRRVLIAQRVAEGSHLQQQVEELVDRDPNGDSFASALPELKRP